jgi:hypothetical protein
MPKRRRKLQYLKCDRCHNDRQKVGRRPQRSLVLGRSAELIARRSAYPKTAPGHLSDAIAVSDSDILLT